MPRTRPKNSRRQQTSRRQRRSRAEWGEIIDRFHAGHATAAAFCLAERINPVTFAQWRKKLQGIAEPAPRFIEVKPPTAATSRRWDLELMLGDGVVLRVGSG